MPGSSTVCSPERASTASASSRSRSASQSAMIASSSSSSGGSVDAFVRTGGGEALTGLGHPLRGFHSPAQTIWIQRSRPRPRLDGDNQGIVLGRWACFWT